MVGVNKVRDLGNEVTPSPSVGATTARAASPTMTDSAASNSNVSTRGDRATSKGVGWLMMVLVFSCVAAVPFVIAAIVLLGR